MTKNSQESRIEFSEMLCMQLYKWKSVKELLDIVKKNFHSKKQKNIKETGEQLLEKYINAGILH